MADQYGVIGVSVPNPLVHSSRKGGIFFGKHHVTAAEMFDSNFFSLYGRCGGDLELYGEGQDEVKNLDREPIEVRCGRCDFSFRLHPRNMTEAIDEWIRIVLGYAIFEARFSPYFRPEGHGASIEIARFPFCNPPTVKLNEELGRFLEKVAGFKDKAWWGQGTPQFFLPKWGDHRIIVAGVIDYEKPEVKDLMIANLAFLLRHLEQGFQEAIKRSAQLATSASESFHPDTRRPIT